MNKAIEEGAFFLGEITVAKEIELEAISGGIAPNAPWVLEAIQKAVKMFPNQGLQRLAGVCASADQFAIETIEQAPILILTLSGGKPVNNALIRKYLAHKFKGMLDNDRRIKKLMARFGWPMPFRAFTGGVMTPRMLRDFRNLAAVAPSVLAQAIPEPRKGQRPWLLNLRDFYLGLSNRGHAANRSEIFEWAVKNIPAKSGRNGVDHVQVGEVCDYACEPLSGFNTNLTWEAARLRCAAWHHRLAVMTGEEQFFAMHGIGFTDPVDYAPFPNVETMCGGFKFVPLRSGIMLYEEGRAMHHCVSSYSRDVVLNGARIFSIMGPRGRRLATVEYRRDKSRGPSTSVIRRVVTITSGPLKGYQPVQIKGPCNARPSAEVAEAAMDFLLDLNPGGPA